MINNTLLKCIGIEKKFRDNFVFKNIYLSIQKGSFISLLGASGCGKSTLLKTLNGLIKLDKGSIEYNIDKRDIQFVFQNYTLFPWLTCIENVSKPLIINGYNKKEARKIASKYLKEVGLQKHENKFPHELSGGMKQRAAIARALSLKPKLILMDEPFGALDTKTKQTLQNLLLKLYQKYKMSVVFVTHDVREAVFLSDRVYSFNNDEKSFNLPITIDLNRPRSRFIEESQLFENYYKKLIELI